jgi:serine/threonine-protein kinase HipA
MGVLTATPARGREVFSFEYDEGWIEAGHPNALDPALRLHRGAQYLPDGRENFGVFLDSSPDRWGRVLLQRREAQLAREEKRGERRLVEHDYPDARQHLVEPRQRLGLEHIDWLATQRAD